jgi:hypothetical protein
VKFLNLNISKGKATITFLIYVAFTYGLSFIPDVETIVNHSGQGLDESLQQVWKIFFVGYVNVAALVFSCFYILYGNLENMALSKHFHNRFIVGMISALFVGLTEGVIVGFAFEAVNLLNFGLVFGLSFGLFAGFITGLIYASILASIFIRNILRARSSLYT